MKANAYFAVTLTLAVQLDLEVENYFHSCCTAGCVVAAYRIYGRASGKTAGFPDALQGYLHVEDTRSSCSIVQCMLTSLLTYGKQLTGEQTALHAPI